ncbi:MAG: acyl-CoA thioesterase [Phycisphaerae bacterium]|nr:acyl-CoA thioesterase [Phycisphaerae bacterium]
METPLQTGEMEIRVRYAEVDAMGYLHHARYAVYFEMGRTELLRARGLRYRDLEAQGLFYVVARLDCRFRAPARYDDLLRLTTMTMRVTPVRVDHAYRLHHGDRLLAEASSTLVLVGRDGHPMRMPEALFDVLSAPPSGPAG